MFDSFQVKKVLVIAPLNVARFTWEEEINKWDHLNHIKLSKVLGTEKERIKALNVNADIYIINRDNVNWLIDFYVKDKSFPFDFLVIDESSSFKSHRSKRFKGYVETNVRKRHFGLKHIAPSIPRVLLLTGTPAPNGLMDLWSQIYLLDKGKRLGTNITSFRKKYFYPSKQNGHTVFEYSLMPDADKLIYSQIGDIVVSLEAKDHIKMPERIDNVIKVHLSDEERKVYKSLHKERILEIGENEVSALSAGVLANKLLQLSNGAFYDDQGEVLKIHDAKLDALEDIVEASCGKPLLILYNYKHDRDRILERFKSLNPRELNGSTDKQDWDAGRIQMLVVHPASMSHGLNLQSGGSTIVWFGLNWSLELYQQANSRLYRQGQKNTVVINHIALSDSIDEDVLDRLKSKEVTQQDLIDAVKARIEKGLNDDIQTL